MNEHTDAEPAASRRWRPRVSLLSAILLMTIVGLTVGVVQMYREMEPLRVENRRMRTELGQLTIDDPTHAYAISLLQHEDDAWRWRIYLPQGKHSIYTYAGKLPNQATLDKQKWLEAVKSSGSGMSSSGANLHGEFVMDAKLIKQGDTWYLATNYTTRAGGDTSTNNGKSSINQPSRDWLSDRRSRMTSSDLSADQKSFEPGMPILLLHMIEPVITELPGGGHRSDQPTGPANGIAVWIETDPGANNASKKK